MTFRPKFTILALAIAAGLSSHVAIADPISCANSFNSPQVINGKLLTTFTCDVSNTGGTSTLSLVPYLTQGGATLANNNVGAGYSVIISGNPLTISSNNTDPSALYNTALWLAVLFSPADLPGGASDSVTVYWPGFFPSATTVRSVDEALYPSAADSLFFTQATFPITTIGPFNVNLTPVSSNSPVPEPGTLTLLSTGLIGLAGIGRAKLAQRRESHA